MELWAVAIVGGTIATVVGGLLLRALQNSSKYRRADSLMAALEYLRDVYDADQDLEIPLPDPSKIKAIKRGFEIAHDRLSVEVRRSSGRWVGHDLLQQIARWVSQLETTGRIAEARCSQPGMSLIRQMLAGNRIDYL